MKTKIRKDILNLPSEAWIKIEQIACNGYIEVTPKELIDLVGFNGGQFLTAKLNDEERIFVDTYYEMGRVLAKNYDLG